MRSIQSASDAPGTRQRILAAAEQLFAERGVAGATMRAVTSLAGANMAAVNYHFGNKDNLAIEVFRDVARRTARARLDRLAAVEAAAEAEGRRAQVVEIVDTFLEPYMTPRTGDLLAHLVLSHKVQPSPWTHAVVREELDGLASRYVDALHRAAPHLTRVEATWRYHLLVGTVLMGVADTGPDSRLSRLSQGFCDPTDRAALRRELAGFLADTFARPTAEALAGLTAQSDGRQGRDQDQDENVDREEPSCLTPRGPSPP
ncbi:TetR/AcrR family transcriptional regulator [Albimonas sp. CAU 1670]|uniref:TetR/AcrR family transcriptional regulator n=1 Tax=Albimonas sp. CAU 1670 TaxID=3032599 RepID=UPI0023DA5BB2|nr:TetR/AcrR family transcriptional regulator [Albimonas sp. CAU 1670]MDF2232243.1 TetR/AcrR family transcriptional regulator [Albimonas sp. CAU 1670]